MFARNAVYLSFLPSKLPALRIEVSHMEYMESHSNFHFDNFKLGSIQIVAFTPNVTREVICYENFVVIIPV